MSENLLASIFGFIGPFYGLIVPLCLVFLLAVLFLASMSVPGAKPSAVGEAVYCYMLHALSVMLMTMGALPTVFSVFAGYNYSGTTYVALLLVFAFGGLLFLAEDHAARRLDAAAKAVPEAIYMTAVKLIGNVVAIVSAVSLVVSIVLATFEPGWWVNSLVWLLYGLLLSWCTRSEHDWLILKSLQAGTPSRSASMRPKARKSTRARRRK